MKTTATKRKQNDRFFLKVRFLKTIALQNDRCIKLAVSSRMVNEDPSLTIVNEERRREETTLKGIGTYH